MDDSSSKPGFFERLVNRIAGESPDTEDDVLQILREAYERQVFDADTLQYLKNILDFSDLEVRDVMITRSQMDVIKIDDTPEKIITYIVDTAHSRFPVIGEDKDQILGILHAKDLLKYWGRAEQFQLEQILRPAVFVPESKSLNILLKDFREKRNHMAIVVDEYGGISGLVTFEDVIEPIIGDIEDEFDEDDSADNIFAVSAERFCVNAVTEIETVNEFFGTNYSDEDVDTIGGLVIQELGHMPLRGEKITIGKLNFTVARADARRLQTLMVTINKQIN